MEFISQYQYPLIGIGILIIMGLVGYLADQKENGKIAEYKKERKAKLEEKKKLKEQQKAEKMKLQEEKKNEKLRLQEEKKKQKEQQAAEKKEAQAPKEEVMVAAALEQNEPEQELEIVENTDENSSEDLFVIEEPIVEETPQEEVIHQEETVSFEPAVEETPEEVIYQEETVSFEPAVPVESNSESFITESGEDLSVPFAFNNTASVTTEDNSLKSESSLDFNALLEEVQAEEASLETSEEDEFLKSMNNVPKPVNTEDDDALKVFMQPTVSSVKKDDMTSDNLDEWKL